MSHGNNNHSGASSKSITKKWLASDLAKLKAEILEHGNLPHHIAIIMDGNGRWAQQRGLPRVAGHNEGVKSVRDVVEAAGEIGVKALTLYAFSQENWKRPTWEVSALMKLLMRTIHNELNNLHKQNVRVKTIGHIELLPADTLKQLLGAVEKTKHNTGLILNLALSYSARIEILDAIKNIARDVHHHKFNVDDINEALFTKYLNTADLPEPDLVIRTSGEFRVSNFLLWQIAYSEIYITDTFWPDFRKPHLFDAIRDYQKRERRFGKVSEQVTVEKNKKAESKKIMAAK